MCLSSFTLLKCCKEFFFSEINNCQASELCKVAISLPTSETVENQDEKESGGLVREALKNLEKQGWGVLSKANAGERRAEVLPSDSLSSSSQQVATLLPTIIRSR